MFPIVRVLIGLVFVVSGAEKLLSPHQNFVYIIEAYQLFPGWAAELTARIFPWLELLVGVFMVLGLWTRQAILGSMIFSAAFICIVGQALLRKLPIDQCGCFGELIHVPPQTIIVFDSGLVLLTVLLLRNLKKSENFSLDRYFQK